MDNKFVTMIEYKNNSVLEYIEECYKIRKAILIYYLKEEELDGMFNHYVSSYHKKLIGAYNEIYDDIEFAPHGRSYRGNFGRYYLNEKGFFIKENENCFYDLGGYGIVLDGEKIYTSMSFEDIVSTYKSSKRLTKIK